MTMTKTALIIIDVQEAIVTPKLFEKELMIKNLICLTDFFHRKESEVMYVRHDDGIDSELAYQTPGWQIYHELKPLKEEKIFNKTRNSAFIDNGLADHLKQSGIQRLVIAGLMTEYCIDATVKSAFEQGFDVIVPRDANSTMANEYLSAERLHAMFNDKIWNKRFACVMSTSQIIKLLS